jgi:hypothetical protein
MMIYESPEKKNILAARRCPYRNHYSLFVSETALIIVRSETGLRHAETDAILEYDVFFIDKDKSKLSNANVGMEWKVSFDNLKFSPDPKTALETSLLYCWGEWWYFDRGFVLRGTKRGGIPVLIYYEFYQDDAFSLPQQQNVQKNNNAFIQTILRPLAKDATVDIEAIQQMSIVPSNRWFEDRTLELSRGDTSYFIPKD